MTFPYEVARQKTRESFAFAYDAGKAYSDDRPGAILPEPVRNAYHYHQLALYWADKSYLAHLNGDEIAEKVSCDRAKQAANACIASSNEALNLLKNKVKV